MNKKNAAAIRYGIEFGRHLAYDVLYRGVDQPLAMKILTYEPVNAQTRAARRTFARIILNARSGD